MLECGVSVFESVGGVGVTWILGAVCLEDGWGLLSGWDWVVLSASVGSVDSIGRLIGGEKHSFTQACLSMSVCVGYYQTHYKLPF